jgi:hypothetical protein
MNPSVRDLQKAGGIRNEKERKGTSQLVRIPLKKHSHRTPVRDGGRNGTISDRRPIPIHFKTIKGYYCFIFSIFLAKGFLSFVEEESFLRFFPMDILKKGLNVIGPFKTVIDHKGVLKDIHNEDGHSP